METNTAPGGVQPAGDSTALLAEFGRWLGRERGLSLVSVQCYSKQSKAFLTWIGGAGAVSGLDAGKVTAFMVDGPAGSRSPARAAGPSGSRCRPRPGRPWPPG